MVLISSHIVLIHCKVVLSPNQSVIEVKGLQIMKNPYSQLNGSIPTRHLAGNLDGSDDWIAIAYILVLLRRQCVMKSNNLQLDEFNDEKMKAKASFSDENFWWLMGPLTWIMLVTLACHTK